MISGPEEKLYNFLSSKIEKNFVGPDCFWQPRNKQGSGAGRKQFFGNAWWIPFPPTLVKKSS